MGFYASWMSKKSGEGRPKKPRDPFAVAFGARLREVRDAKIPKLTGDALGAQLGGTKTTISHWESGEHMPDLKNLVALCDALGCSADQLLGRRFGGLSAAALEEARAYDELPEGLQRKWRAMRLTMFSTA